MMQFLHAVIVVIFLIETGTTVNPAYHKREDEDASRPRKVSRHGDESAQDHPSNSPPAQVDTIPTTTINTSEFVSVAGEREQEKLLLGARQGGSSNGGQISHRRQLRRQRKDGNSGVESDEREYSTNSTEVASQNSRTAQKSADQVHQNGAPNGKSSRKRSRNSRPPRRGKKGENERVYSQGQLDITHSPHQGRGNFQAAFNHLSLGAGQMMKQWMVEAERRYPQEFSQLTNEWIGIMEDFENISLDPSDENPVIIVSDSSEEEGCNEAKDYNYDFETGPSKDCSEKPSYTVVCTSPAGYEVRRYDIAPWVSTFVNTSSYDFAGMVGFKKLFEYIQGRNDQGVRLAMTVPVRKRIWSDDGEIAPVSLLRDENFVVSFFLPSKNAQNPPAPVDDELFIQQPSYFVYAFNFSGWAYGLNVYEKYFQYENILRENREPFVRGDFRMQMYDSPWVPSDRHNELLIPVDEAEGHPTCGTQTASSYLASTDCVYDGCPSQIVIKTISIRRSISIRLLQAGAFVVHSRSGCDNLTDIMDQEDFLSMPNSQGCIRDTYLSLNLPVFLKARGLLAEDSSDCRFNWKKQFFLPESFRGSLPQSETIFEGSLHTDSTSPTLYFVMTLQESRNQRLTNDDVYEQYQRMTRILHDKGFCYDQGTFMLAYYRGQHSPENFELFLPVDLQCSDSQTV